MHLLLELTWHQRGLFENLYFEDAKKWVKQPYADFIDWRLPTLEEAMSLMEPEMKGDHNFDYIDPIFDQKRAGLIWTSDLAIGIPENAWVVIFGYGRCHYTTFDEDIPVLAVRSGQANMVSGKQLDFYKNP